jgi:hypothetical protein
MLQQLFTIVSLLFTPTTCDHYVDTIIVSLDGPLVSDGSGRAIGGVICHSGAEVYADDGLSVTVGGEPWSSSSEGELEVWEAPGTTPVCGCTDPATQAPFTAQCQHQQSCHDCCKAAGGTFISGPIVDLIPPCMSCPHGPGCC